MRRFSLTVANIAAGIYAIGVLASSASAETLDLVCTRASESQTRPVTIDLATGPVSNGAGYDERRWVARVTDNDRTWDETFHSRIGHSANHYVYERASGALHDTDIDGREVLSAVCHKRA
jgi:hypothetical protein